MSTISIGLSKLKMKGIVCCVRGLFIRLFYQIPPPPPIKILNNRKYSTLKTVCFFKMGIGILSFAALKGGRDDPCFLHILTLKTVYDMNYRV